MRTAPRCAYLLIPLAITACIAHGVLQVTFCSLDSSVASGAFGIVGWRGGKRSDVNEVVGMIETYLGRLRLECQRFVKLNICQRQPGYLLGTGRTVCFDIKLNAFLVGDKGFRIAQA